MRECRVPPFPSATSVRRRSAAWRRRRSSSSGSESDDGDTRSSGGQGRARPTSPDGRTSRAIRRRSCRRTTVPPAERPIRSNRSPPTGRTAWPATDRGRHFPAGSRDSSATRPVRRSKRRRRVDALPTDFRPIGSAATTPCSRTTTGRIARSSPASGRPPTKPNVLARTSADDSCRSARRTGLPRRTSRLPVRSSRRRPTDAAWPRCDGASGGETFFKPTSRNASRARGVPAPPTSSIACPTRRRRRSRRSSTSVTNARSSRCRRNASSREREIGSKPGR